MRHYPGSVVLGEYFRLINGNAMRWQLLIHYQIDQNRAIYEYLCFRQSRGKFECIAVERREESLGWLTGILWCSCDYQTELVVASSVTHISDFIQASDNNRSRECEEWGTRRRKEWYLLLPFSDNYQVDALDQFLCSLSFQMKAPAKFSIFALLQFNQKPRYQMNYLCSKSQEGNQKYIWNHYPAGREKNQDWRKESESTLQSKKRRGNSDIWILETKCSDRFCLGWPRI